MSIFEQNLIMGTFTNRTQYLPGLLESVKKYFSNVPFIVHIADAPINQNFEALRKKFIQTKKRYFLFLDDDVRFVDPYTIDIALKTMLRGKYAMVGVYSTFDPNQLDGFELVEREVSWIPGYFQLVDSNLVGDVKADLELPDSNTAIDTSYSVMIKSIGHKIGLAPIVVYHIYKKVWMNQEAANKTNAYMMKKWGRFYFDCCGPFPGIVGKIPEQEETSIMERNKAKLMGWQKEHYSLENDKIKLNVGCGDVKLNGYINCDLYGSPDVKCSMESLPFEDNYADEISCHHSLEHIPYNQVVPTLEDWFRVLKLGGILDLGMPDAELCMKAFLDANEKDKWGWNIQTLWGSQENEGQFHLSGLSLNRAIQLLQLVGFKVIDQMNYDGNSTPSLWILARKG